MGFQESKGALGFTPKTLNCKTPVSKNNSAQNKVVESLKAAHEEMVKGWSNGTPGEIVKYLSKAWSDPIRSIYINDVTKHVNALIQSESSLCQGFLGEQVNPRKVGEIIRNQLGLKTERKNKGYIISLDISRLNELKRKYVTDADKC